jgi:hypothetical protein
MEVRGLLLGGGVGEEGIVSFSTRLDSLNRWRLLIFILSFPLIPHCYFHPKSGRLFLFFFQVAFDKSDVSG